MRTMNTWFSTWLVQSSIVFLVLMSWQVHSADVVWDGGAGTGIWSDAANWDTDTVPGISDRALFTAGSESVTITVPVSVAAIETSGAWTGSIFQQATASVSGSWSILAGTWDASDQVISIGGDATIATTATFVRGTSTVHLTGTGSVSNSEVANGFHILTCASAGKTTTIADTLVVRGQCQVGPGVLDLRGTTESRYLRLYGSGNMLQVSGTLSGWWANGGQIWYESDSTVPVEIAGGDYGQCAIWLITRGAHLGRFEQQGAISNCHFVNTLAESTGGSVEWHTNSHDLTCTVFLSLGGGIGTGGTVLYAGASHINSGSNFAWFSNDADVIHMETSQWLVSSWGAWSPAGQVIPGSSHVTVTGGSLGVSWRNDITQRFYDLVLQGTGVTQQYGPLVADGSVHVASGTWDLGGSAATIAGNLTVADGASVHLVAQTVSVGGDCTFEPSSVFQSGTATLRMTGTGVLTTLGADQSIHSLEVGFPSQTTNLGSDVSVTSTCTVAGGTFDLRNAGTGHILHLQGSGDVLTNNGSLQGAWANGGQIWYEALDAQPVHVAGTNYGQCGIRLVSRASAAAVFEQQGGITNAHFIMTDIDTTGGSVTWNTNDFPVVMTVFLTTGNGGAAMGPTHLVCGASSIDAGQNFAWFTGPNDVIELGSSHWTVRNWGAWTSSTIVDPGTSRVTVQGGQIGVPWRTDIVQTFYDVVVDALASETPVAVFGALNVGGDVILANGTLQNTSGPVTLSGDVSSGGGRLDASGQSVILNGVGAQNADFGPTALAGTLAIPNGGRTLSIGGIAVGAWSVPAETTVQVLPGATIAVSQDLSLLGTAGQPVVLGGAIAGSSWQLQVDSQATQHLTEVRVSDSNASSGAVVDARSGGVDLGGNTNWLFATGTPSVGFNQPTTSVGEGAGSAVLGVTLSAPASTDVVVTWALQAGTAQAGADYTVPSILTLTIPVGDITGAVSIPIIDDAVIEADETFTVTLTGVTGGVLGGSSSEIVTIVDNDQVVGNQPPVIITQPSATPNPVIGTITALTVGADDDGGEANLSYHWSSTGPTGVSFSINDQNLAKSATATFAEVGSYVLTVTITDGAGATAQANVSVTVQGTATMVTVTPTTLTIARGANQHFTAAVSDQFNAAIISPSVAWSVDILGAIDANGDFTAGTTLGSATVTATSGSTSGQAMVTIVNTPPTVAVAATANPNPVTGTTSSLAVLGADDLDESTLQYAWSATGPASVNFSAANTNAAKNVVATFPVPGLYAVTATITDTDGATVTSVVQVQVGDVVGPATVIVTPVSVSVPPGAQVPFTATVFDQDGNVIPGQSVVWSTDQGSIDSAGVLTAPIALQGDVTVTATADSVQASAQVHVDAGLLELSLGPVTKSVSEGDDVQFMVLSLTNGKAPTVGSGMEPLAVTLSMTGSAEEGADYILSQGPYVFSPGQSSLQVPVGIIDDGVVEPTESVTFTVISVTGGPSIAPAHQSTWTITDNDVTGLPTITFSAPEYIMGEDGSGSRPLIVRDSTVGETQIEWTLNSGSLSLADLSASSGVVVIPDGASSAEIPVSVIDDEALEGQESANIALTVIVNGRSGTTMTATLIVNDNEQSAVVEFASATSSAVEGTSTITIPILVDMPVGRNIDVAWTLDATSTAVGGVDYTAPASNLLTIPANGSGANVQFTLRDDYVSDGPKTMVFTLTYLSPGETFGTITTHTLTIADNEPGPPIFTPDGGAFSDGALPQVQIASMPAGNMVVYTMAAGTTLPPKPTRYPLVGTIYSGPITLTGTTTIRAVSVVNGYEGPVTTRTFLVIPSGGYLPSKPGGNVTDLGGGSYFTSSPVSPAPFEFSVAPSAFDGLSVSRSVGTGNPSALFPTPTSSSDFAINVGLDETAATRVTVTAPGVARTIDVTWSVTDLLGKHQASDEMVIRVGDALRFAVTGYADGMAINPTGSDVSGATTAGVNGSVAHAYNQPGEYIATGWKMIGSTSEFAGDVRVIVVGTGFQAGEAVYAEVDQTREIDLPVAPVAAANRLEFISSEPSLASVTTTSTTGDTLTGSLTVYDRGTPYLLVRLTSGGAGPIPGALVQAREVVEFTVEHDAEKGSLSKNGKKYTGIVVKPALPGLQIHLSTPSASLITTWTTPIPTTTNPNPSPIPSPVPDGYVTDATLHIDPDDGESMALIPFAIPGSSYLCSFTQRRVPADPGSDDIDCSPERQIDTIGSATYPDYYGYYLEIDPWNDWINSGIVQSYDSGIGYWTSCSYEAILFNIWDYEWRSLTTIAAGSAQYDQYTVYYNDTTTSVTGPTDNSRTGPSSAAYWDYKTPASAWEGTVPGYYNSIEWGCGGVVYNQSPSIATGIVLGFDGLYSNGDGPSGSAEETKATVTNDGSRYTVRYRKAAFRSSGDQARSIPVSIDALVADESGSSLYNTTVTITRDNPRVHVLREDGTPLFNGTAISQTLPVSALDYHWTLVFDNDDVVVLSMDAPGVSLIELEYASVSAGIGPTDSASGSLPIAGGYGSINPWSGNLHFDAPIYQFGSAIAGPDVQVAYNSQDTIATGLGVGWRSTYDMHLYGNPKTGMGLISGLGERISFPVLPGGSSNTLPASGDATRGAGAEIQVRHTQENGSDLPADLQDGEWYRLIPWDGHRYYFDQEGRLVRVADLADRNLTVTYNGSDPSPDSVADDVGRSVDLTRTALTGDTGSDQTPLAQLDLGLSGRWVFAYDTNKVLTSITLEEDNGGATGTGTFTHGGHSLIWTVTQTGGQVTHVTAPTVTATQLPLIPGNSAGAAETHTFGYDTIDYGGERFAAETTVTRPETGSLEERWAFANSDAWVTHTDLAGVEWSRSVVDNATDGPLDGRHIKQTTLAGTAREDFSYDAHGNLVFHRLRGAPNPDMVESWVYEDLGLLGANLLTTHTVAGVSGIASEPAPVDLVTTYTYATDGHRAGLLTSVTDPCQQGQTPTMRYAYNSAGYLVSSRDALDAETVFGNHTAFGDPRTVTSPENRVTTMAYRLPTTVPVAVAGLTVTGSPEGYDGQAVAITNAWQIRTDTTFDRLRRPVSVATSAVGDERVRTQTVTYDPLGHSTSQEDAENRVVSMTYDAAGRPITTTTPAGLPDTTTAYHHDTGTGEWTITTQIGNEFQPQQKLDAIGRPIATVTWRNRVETAPGTIVGGPTACSTAITYDPATGWVASTADEEGRSTIVTRDLAGRTVAVQPSGNEATETWRTQVNEAGWMVLSTTPEGHETSMAYDRCGRERTSTNALSGITTMEYDAIGQLLSQQGPQGAATTMAYDPDGIRTAVTGRLGRTIRTEVNTMSRQIRAYDLDLPAKSTTKHFDPLGDPTKVSTPFGTTDRQFALDGTPTRIEPPNRLPTQVVRNPINGIVESTHRDNGGTPMLASHVEVDPDSARVTKNLSPTGFLGVPTFDSVTGSYLGSEDNLDADPTDPEMVTTTGEILAYDHTGAPLLERDAAGREIRIEYDARGRAYRRHTPTHPTKPTLVAFTIETLYTPEGRVDTVTRTASSVPDQIIHYQYDALGQTIKATRTGSTSEDIYSATWTNAGELLTERRFHETLVRTLDPTTRLLLREVRNGDQVTVYEYDSLNRLQRVRGGFAVGEAAIAQLPVLRSFTRDSYDRVEVESSPLGDDRRTWDSNGDLATRSLPGGEMRIYDWDDLGRMASEVRSRPLAGGQTMTETTDYTYEYPTAGAVTIHGETVAAGNGMVVTASTSRSDGSASTMVSTYDRGGRLRQRVVDGAVEDWNYGLDRDLSEAGPFHYTYDGAGRLETLADQRPGGSTAIYTYDSAGRLKTVTVGGVQHTYDYDGEDRVTSLTRTVDGVDETDVATRDGAGRILRLISPEGERRMVYDPAGRLAAERRIAGVDSWVRVSAFDGRGNRTGSWTGTPESGSGTAFDQPWTTTSGELPTELIPTEGTWQSVSGGTSAQGAGPFVADLALSGTLGPWFSVSIQQPNTDLTAGQERAAGLRFGAAAVLVVTNASGEQRLEIRVGTTGSWTVLGASSPIPAQASISLVVIRQGDDQFLAQLENGSHQVLAQVQATAAGAGLLPGLIAEGLAAAAADATFTGLVHDRIAPLEAVTSTFDLANHLTMEVRTVGESLSATSTYDFDVAGDLRERREMPVDGVASVTTYHWDVRHRLAKQDLPDGTSIAYGYLGNSYRRSSLSAGMQATTFSWQGDHQIAQFVNGAATGYLPGPSGRPLAMISALGTTSPVPFAYAQDLLGDVVGSVRSAVVGDPEEGSWVYAQRFSYDAWGKGQERIRVVEDFGSGPAASYLTSAQLSTGPRYKGQWQDASGEIYLRNRMYSPGTGRFLSADPARMGGNWYAYAGGDPVNRYDPSGLIWVYHNPPGEWVWHDDGEVEQLAEQGYGLYNAQASSHGGAEEGTLSPVDGHDLRQYYSLFSSQNSTASGPRWAPGLVMAMNEDGQNGSGLLSSLAVATERERIRLINSLATTIRAHPPVSGGNTQDPRFLSIPGGPWSIDLEEAGLMAEGSASQLLEYRQMLTELGQDAETIYENRNAIGWSQIFQQAWDARGENLVKYGAHQLGVIQGLPGQLEEAKSNPKYRGAIITAIVSYLVVEGVFHVGGKMMNVGRAGHHMPAVRKSLGRHFEVERADMSRPTLHFKGSIEEQGASHWRLHDSERPFVGSRQGDFPGTDSELFNAYRKSYRDLNDIKVDLRSPDGTHVLGIDVTPLQAVDLMEAWLKKERLWTP